MKREHLNNKRLLVLSQQAKIRKMQLDNIEAQRTLEVDCLRELQLLETNLMLENAAKQSEVEQGEIAKLLGAETSPSGSAIVDATEYMNALVEQEKNLLKEKHNAVLRMLLYDYEKRTAKFKGQQQIDRLETELVFRNLEWDLKFEHGIVKDAPGKPSRTDIAVSDREVHNQHISEIERQVEKSLEKLKTQYKKAKAKLRYLNVSVDELALARSSFSVPDD